MLYNSRITRNYIVFLKKNYPALDINALLEEAGISRHQVDDPGHWFCQEDVDRFQGVVAARTGNPNISLEVGRNLFRDSSIPATNKKYLLGLLNLTNVYLGMDKVYAKYSRAASLEGRKLGAAKVEIVSRPKPGVLEKSYQCENRLGSFQAIGFFFLGFYPDIEHPECLHEGGEVCRYIISWRATALQFWKRFRNVSLPLGGLVLIGLAFGLPAASWNTAFLVVSVPLLVLFGGVEYFDRKALQNVVLDQGNTAADLIEEANIRYNNALLIQEVGQATGNLMDVDDICLALMKVIDKNQSYGRGILLLADQDGKALRLRSDFGVAEEHKEMLQNFDVATADRNPPGILASVFKNKKPFMSNSLDAEDSALSVKGRYLTKFLGVCSLLCVPIVHENKALGVLVVDKPGSPRRLFTQSDINLLQGVASQTAGSIVNARSFCRIRESEAIHRTLIETMADIVFMLDAGNRFTFVSPIVETLVGYLPAEMIGRHFSAFFMPHEEPGHLVATGEVGTEKIMTGRFQMRVINGDRSIPFEVNVAPISQGGSDSLRLIGVARDISQRVREDIVRQEMEIKAMGQSKLASLGEISTGIAHEINQPLSYINLTCQTTLRDLRKGCLDHVELEQDFSEVLKQVARIVRIINHLRIFGRSDSLNSEEDVNLAEVLDNTLILLEERIRLRDISLELDVAAELPVVLGNSTKLEQVMINLFQNAVDALQERKDGSIRVTIKPDGTNVVFCLADNGCGVASEHLERIFEPFFTTKEVGRGTGVGLSIVYGIVQEHRGEISCRSDSKGTEFVIILPGRMP